MINLNLFHNMSFLEVLMWSKLDVREYLPEKGLEVRVKLFLPLYVSFDTFLKA